MRDRAEANIADEDQTAQNKIHRTNHPRHWGQQENCSYLLHYFLNNFYPIFDKPGSSNQKLPKIKSYVTKGEPWRNCKIVVT